MAPKRNKRTVLKELKKDKNNLIVEIDNEPVISSLRISEITGVCHCDVFKKIELLFEGLEDKEEPYMEHLGDSSVEKEHYLLTEREMNFLVASY